MSLLTLVVLHSVFNGAGVVGTELGAALTSLLGVTESDFDNLATLVTLCSVSSLTPLLAINWLDEVRDMQPTEELSNGQGPGKSNTVYEDTLVEDILAGPPRALNVSSTTSDSRS